MKMVSEARLEAFKKLEAAYMGLVYVTNEELRELEKAHKWARIRDRKSKR